VWGDVLTLFEKGINNHNVNFSQNSTVQVTRVRVASKVPIRVPARSVIVVNGTAGSHPCHHNLVVEPLLDAPLPQNVVVFPTCSAAYDG